MIQGLRATVTGAELRQLCEERAETLDNKAKLLREQAQLGGLDTDNLLHSATINEGLAIEMRFIAAHVSPKTRYLLDGHDLHHLGIAPLMPF